jgi:hypothetical protein
LSISLSPTLSREKNQYTIQTPFAGEGWGEGVSQMIIESLCY